MRTALSTCTTASARSPKSRVAPPSPRPGQTALSPDRLPSVHAASKTSECMAVLQMSEEFAVLLPLKLAPLAAPLRRMAGGRGPSR